MSKSLSTFLSALVISFIVLVCSQGEAGRPPTTIDTGEQIIRIGVLARRGPEQCIRSWRPTAEYLSSRIEGFHFQIVPLDFDEVVQSVEAKAVDFVVVNSSFYVELKALFGVTRIATMKDSSPGSAAALFGGVIFCRTERSDIASLKDLKGKSFIGVDETSFGGWRAASRELKENGIDPYRDFTRLSFAGTHDATAFAVRDGTADAGTIATPVLEEMIDEGKIDPRLFKVINEQHHYNFPYVHSTRLYPKWPLAMLRHTPNALAERVAIALLSMPAGDPAAQAADLAGWTVPLDYGSVDECLKELRIGIYKDFGKIDFTASLSYYRWHVFISLCAIGSLITFLFVIFYLNRSLRVSAVALREESLERKRAQEALERISRRHELILMSAAEGILGLDVEGNVTFVNSSAIRMTGWELPELIGTCHHEKVHHTKADGSIHPRAECPVHDSLARGKTHRITEEVFWRKDGTSFPVEYVSTPIMEEGRPVGVVITFRDITELKRAQGAILESEKKFRMFYEQAPLSYQSLEEEGRIIDVNRAWLDFFGYEKNEVLGRWFGDFLAPGSLEVFSEHFACFKGLGEAGGVEFETIRKDGTHAIVALYGNIAHNENGEFKQTHCILQDITERKRAEEEKKETVDLLEILSSNCDTRRLMKTVAAYLKNCSRCEAVGIRLREDDDFPYFETQGFPEQFVQAENRLCAVDRNGELVGDFEGNPVLECMCGNVLCGRFDPAMPFFTPKGSFWTNSTTDLLSSTTEADRQSRTRNRCNGEGYESVALIPLRSGGQTFGLLQLNDRERGRFTPQLISLFERFSDHIASALGEKRAKEALRMNEEKYRTLFDTMSQGVFYRRADGVLVDVNPAALRMFGLTREEFLGKTPEDLSWNLINEDGTPLTFVESPSMMALKTCCHVKDVVAGVFNPQTKSYVWMMVNAIPQFHPGEEFPHSVFVTLHDITLRRQAEEEKEKLEAQFRQAQKMESVGRLAGGVAHDFNNMLNVILGYAELALDRLGPAESLYQELCEIQKAAGRSADLTRQLLAFARKQTVNPRLLDLNDTISGMLKMLRRLIGEDVDLTLKPAQDLWLINIDPSQIDQVLANLAVNARDAISGVGSLTLKTENVMLDAEFCARHAGFLPGEYVLLSVNDTGAGMSRDVVDHIFEPFFTTKEIGRGTGLGLATVYGIVKQNNGFINVLSENGKGTTFEIYFPRFEVENGLARVANVAVKPQTGTETILLVEDEEAILNLGKMVLEGLGYKIFAARTPKEAIGLAENLAEDIHLLITDVVMPEMNGRDLVEQLGAVRPGLKRLFMSGYTNDMIALKGVLDKGLNFIQKPFRIDELALKVREVLDQNSPDASTSSGPAINDEYGS